MAVAKHPAGHAGPGAVSHKSLCAPPTVRAGGVCRAAITEPRARLAGAQLVAAAVRVAGLACPAELAVALEVRGSRALAVFSTGRLAGLAAAHPVTFIARHTGALEGPGRVETGGPGVTVVQAEAALVNIRAGEVAPLLVRRTGGPAGAGPVTPPAPQPAQAVGAGGEVRAAVTFLLHLLAGGGEVRPVLATSELELAGVD